MSVARKIVESIVPPREKSNVPFHIQHVKPYLGGGGGQATWMIFIIFPDLSSIFFISGRFAPRTYKLKSINYSFSGDPFEELS